MKNGPVFKKSMILVVVMLFLCNLIISAVLGMNTSYLSVRESHALSSGQEYILPPPLLLNIPVEEALMKRMSVRDFSDEPVTDEELSTVLWAAYGQRDDGKLIVPNINNTHSAVIYVLKEDAVYTYNSVNHSLVWYKDGDYRDTVGWQWKAPVQIGLCWNTDFADETFGSAELGAVGQNIYFAAIALGLGTVITAQTPPAIIPVGLPPNHQGVGVMPLGHPEYSYDFQDKPMWISLLPRITRSEMSLTNAFVQREEGTQWKNEDLSRPDVSHLLWASYGYSYYLDKSEAGLKVITRHHTVPSAHGYYPFRMYLVTKSGIYRYIYGLYRLDKWGLPIVSFLLQTANGDFRENLAQTTQPFIADAPVGIISVLDIRKTVSWDDLSAEELRWIWYYEAGASAYNVVLQATARGLTGNIVPISNKNAVCSLLGLKENNFDPMFIVPVGKPL